MDIVAEGVETEFEAMMMTKLGCTELQGYYFSRPVDADQMTDLLASFQPRRPVSALTPVQLPHGATAVSDELLRFGFACASHEILGRKCPGGCRV